MENKEFSIVLYTVKEAAAIIGCSTRSIMTYIYSEKLKAAKIAGKWRITKDALEAFCKGE